MAAEQMRRLTGDAFLWMRRNVKKYARMYADPDADFCKMMERDYRKMYAEPVDATIDSGLSLRLPTEYDKSPKKAHLSDVQALDVYRSLGGMTPRLASDPYVLAYASHFCLHAYGVERWPVPPAAKKKPDGLADHVRQHWLTESRERPWNASIFGRLWWMAHVATAAAGASGGAFGPEQALRLFSAVPEYYHRTMDYEVLRSPVVMAECLRALMNEARGLNRDGYREMGMELNREAGARVLDSLGRDQVRGLVLRSADRLMRQGRYVRDRRDMVGVSRFRVLSLGAGAQSTVLALMAEAGWEGMERPDLAIFADTRWEPNAVYEHLEWLKGKLSYEVATVSAGSIRDNMLRGVNPDGDRFLDVPVYIRNPDGTGAVARRQCTNHYKIQPIYREIRRRLGVPAGRRFPKGVQVEMWLGISADEATRIKPSRDEWVDRRYPLVEMDLTRANVYRWFEERYPDRRLPRSACVGCPYHDDMEWKWIKENEPGSFEDAVRVDWSLRNVPAARGSLRGAAYLHRSRLPLGEVDLSAARDYDEYMIDECEGLCGV